jgi:hypothetical protein
MERCSDLAKADKLLNAHCAVDTLQSLRLSDIQTESVFPEELQYTAAGIGVGAIVGATISINLQRFGSPEFIRNLPDTLKYPLASISFFSSLFGAFGVAVDILRRYS